MIVAVKETIHNDTWYISLEHIAAIHVPSCSVFMDGINGGCIHIDDASMERVVKALKTEQKVGEASESSAHKLGEFMDALRDGERKDVQK